MLISHRANTILLVAILAVGIGIVAMLASGARGGPLDPPGAPGSTMHNIIYQPASCAGFPIVIGTPGSYLLGADITGCPGKDGIQITTSNVTLDLAGHNVNGGGTASGSLAGIKNVGANGQLSILNGRIQLWGGSGVDLTGSATARIDRVVATNNGGNGVIIDVTSTVMNTTASANGVNGVAAGIKTLGTNNRIASCQADYNTGWGIWILGTGNVVEDCEVGGNNLAGIDAYNISRIVRNHAHNNGGSGINAGDSSTVEDNSVAWNGGYGIICEPNRCSVRGNSATANSLNGITVTGGMSAVDGNYALGNVGTGIWVRAPSAGYPNVVLRNVAASNGIANYFVGVNNDYAPIVTAGAAVNPMSNISN